MQRRFATLADLAAVDVGPVQPWTAETPRLYDATVTSPGETVSLRLGFRTVAIEGARFTVNGRPVTFRGMNRHETHPERGRVFDEAHARTDLLAMKRHNVNAIRTSHYPPHHRVLELADELGFWVVLENDVETHGFVDAGWRGNPSDDPAWEAVYLDRIARTVERDKNHACVVLWSLGNEAGTGRNLAATAQWVRRRDPGRPVHYEGDATGAYTDVYSRMYPSPAEVAAICADSGVIPGLSAVQTQRVRSLPFLMCEYAHAMGNGPGALDTYDAQADASPRHHGGFVWEWRDHGILAHTADGTPYYAYGGDFGEVVHDGNFVMDGMVLPDDTPTPGLAEFAAVNAPVVLAVDGTVLRVTNRHHSSSTRHLRFVAAVEDDGGLRSEAEIAVPAVDAGGSATVDLPEWERAPHAETWVTVRAELAADTAVGARRARGGAHPVRRRTCRATGAPRPGCDSRRRCATPSSTRAPAGSAGCSASTSTARASSCGARLPTTTGASRTTARTADQRSAAGANGAWTGSCTASWRSIRTGPSCASGPAPPAARGPSTSPTAGSSPTRSRCGSRWCPRPTGTAPGRGWASGSTCRRRCGTPAGSEPGRTSRTPTRRAPLASDASPGRRTWRASTG